MDCTEFLDRYSEYDDSLVAAHEGDHFRAHMASCERCARYDRVLRKGRMLARQLAGPEPSNDFVPRLHMRLWSERTRPPRSTVSIPQALTALPAVTIVVALFALLASSQQSVSSAASVSPAATVSPAAPVSPVPQVSSVYTASSGGAGSTRSSGMGRAVALPTVRLAAGSSRPLGWTPSRVDPEASRSYSPLTMGPPAYGGAKSRLEGSLTTYPTPD